jgi:hypothetical protein
VFWRDKNYKPGTEGGRLQRRRNGKEKVTAYKATFYKAAAGSTESRSHMTAEGLIVL